MSAGEETTTSVSNNAESSSNTSRKEISRNHRKYRATILERVFAKTIRKFVGSIKFSAFKEHFADIYKGDRGGLKAVYKEFVNSLEKKLGQESLHFLSEKNIFEILNHLDELIQQQYEASPTRIDSTQAVAWRPSRNPEDDIKVHRINVKLQAKLKLTEMVTELKEEKEHLQAEISNKEKKLDELEKETTQRMMLFERAAVAAERLPVTEIQKYLMRTSSF